jgi:hypothetical protein
MPRSPVYSVPFIEWTNSTPNTEFLVPAGFTAILRDIIFFTAIGDELGSVGYQNAGADTDIRIAVFSAGGVNTTSEWHGRVVVNAGATILLLIGGLSTYSSVYVGGYLLTNDLP